jgi:hypothetical protein
MSEESSSAVSRCCGLPGAEQADQYRVADAVAPVATVRQSRMRHILHKSGASEVAVCPYIGKIKINPDSGVLAFVKSRCKVIAKGTVWMPKLV